MKKDFSFAVGIFLLASMAISMGVVIQSAVSSDIAYVRIAGTVVLVGMFLTLGILVGKESKK